MHSGLKSRTVNKALITSVVGDPYRIIASNGGGTFEHLIPRDLPAGWRGHAAIYGKHERLSQSAV